MTNEERTKLIDDIAHKYAFKKGKPAIWTHGFMVGARWADEFPRRLYIVMRCEEHSDYVEKVFVDKDKAVAYCENYNSNPREYSRTIEEMEVTL
jgi:hypothetical protein